jgi:phosphopentomutase
MPRAFVIVLDAVGVGELPDAAAYGDEGSNTLGNTAEAVGGLELPNLGALGLGNVLPLLGCPPLPAPPSLVGRLRTQSAGKDTTIGHWEMMGIVTPVPMPTYPDGFPADVVERFARETGRGVIGNVAASGTEIIDRLGDEHVATGKWILYTSADSVFQVAAHEEVVPLEELYAACRTARTQLQGEHAVGRVIARPFVGESGDYRRTPNRHDFSLAPARPNHLSRLREAGHRVHSIGKVSDVFAGQDVDTSRPTHSNAEGIEELLRAMREVEDGGLVFSNLVETDMVYGHRNDPEGFHRCLQEFDRALPELRAALRPDDLLVLCSDHGCDPTTPSTDHSREYALLVAHVPGAAPAAGARHDGWLADVGATCFRWITGREPAPGVPGEPIALAAG